MTKAEVVEQKLEIFAENILKPEGLYISEFEDILSIVRLIIYEENNCNKR